MSTLFARAIMPAALGVALAGLIGVAIGQVKSPAKAITLTAMDYVEIRQLVNRYGFALDTGSNNGYDYADLFAADGEFIRPYGTRVEADERGGFRLPKGEHVAALADGLLLPNGVQCPADGAGAYICP